LIDQWLVSAGHFVELKKLKTRVAKDREGKEDLGYRWEMNLKERKREKENEKDTKEKSE
jgi:hypothetical protein